MPEKHTLEAKTQDRDGPASRLLTKRELADYIRISVSTINTWVCQRRIPYLKLGRRVLFKSRDIDKWMDEHKVEPLSEEKNLDF